MTEHSETRQETTPTQAAESPVPAATEDGTASAEGQPRAPALGTPAEERVLASAHGLESGPEPVLWSGESRGPAFVYALGQIDWRFPTLSIEKECAQVAGQSDAAGLTDRQAFQSLLSAPGNRYLARQLCWILTVRGLETYILSPRVPGDIDLLVEAVRPSPEPTDIDCVIGVLGPIAPPELCNALMLPIVIYDQIYSFDVPTLLGAIPRPDKVKADQWEAANHEIFPRMTQMNDNAGATDADRALNYLSVRYPGIYHKAAEKFAANSSLTRVDVRPSRPTGARNIVEVVFAYTDRSTDVTEKLFARVDVTEEFPFLVSKLAPYLERGH